MNNLNITCDNEMNTNDGTIQCLILLKMYVINMEYNQIFLIAVNAFVF